MHSNFASCFLPVMAAVRRPKFVVCLFAASLYVPLWLPAQTAETDDQWQGIANGTQAIDAPLADVSLLQDVVSSGDRLVAVGERGHILVSTDQGASWQQVSGVPTRSMLISVTAAGERLWAVGHDTVIVVSEDNGDSWQMVHDEPGGDPLLDVMFNEQGEGIAIGAYSLMMRSDDWGANWSTDYMVDLVSVPVDEDVSADDALNEMGLIDQDAMAAYEEVGIEYHLNGMVRIDTQTLLVAAEAGHYYYSTDGGRHWTEQRLDYEGSLFGVASSNDGSCLIMYGLRGHVFQNCTLQEAERKLDVWQEIKTGSNAGLFAAADDAERTWLVGANGAIFSLDDKAKVSDFTVDLGDDFTAVMPLAEGLLLLGESGPQIKPYSTLRSDNFATD